MKHLQNNNILTDLQHGFRKNRSCETQLIKTVNDLAKSMNHGEQIDSILLDFSKAFDKVCHRKLLQWEQSWSMEFPPDKCKVSRITNKRRLIKYRYLLRNVILKEVSNAKYLDVTMNTRLSWKKHVHAICSKANQTKQFLQRNLVACKPETKLQCYKTFIRPIVEYSSSVWDPVGNNQLTKQIESVQRKAARWITNNWNYDVSSGQIAKELQLQSLSERRELARLKLLHSIYWGQKFLPKSIIPGSTRYTDIRFKSIYVRVSCYNNSFITYTVKQW